MTEYKTVHIECRSDYFDEIAGYAVTIGAIGSQVTDSTTLGASEGVCTWVAEGELEQFLFELDLWLKNLIPEHAYNVKVTDYVPEDWSTKWRENYYDVSAGRFRVMSSFSPPVVSSDEIQILIDPSMAFGTGHHETTQLCLEEIDMLKQEGGSYNAVLDMGCGSGILAIGSAKLWPDAKVTGIDNDPDVIPVALENSQINGVSVWASTDLPTDSKFDLILANINPAVLVGLRETLMNALIPGGIIILSGIIEEQAEFVKNAWGIEPILKREKNEWVLFRYQKQ
ncbi:50S ribosomal protein L11 methyltransferase [Myxococcota bacterium]|nr:50S ribosomal protein L11 methyltransferase [Myxococcota bacterium]MBU1382191.1 50S ribosomal protein L11 methyltransferase [Myxococcota bacterium]MBU1498719.1 50S ribosomal protein L11 methyltransferase [Myxococcota bacterium]